MVKFDGKILILGCGSVAQCVLPLLFELLDFTPSKVTIIDPVDNRHRVQPALNRGVKYVIGSITENNYQSVLSEHLSKGDLLLDLSVEVDSISVIQWCHDHDVLLVNTALELWPSNPNWMGGTLHRIRLRVEDQVKKWKKKGPTIIIEHGANPGLISHFVKRALKDIGKALCKTHPDRSYALRVEKAVNDRHFAKLACLEGVKTIHISEKDTQIASRKKEPGEFVNTWSCIGFIEEAIAPAELGWGSHEDPHSPFIAEAFQMPSNISLKTRGCLSLVKSWVPSGAIEGRVIHHGEAFTICEALSLYEKKEAIYCPTVHYAYQPCPDAIASLKEVEENGWKPQTRLRILSDEIVSGFDELGCLVMGHDLTSWWTGSILDIDEARRLAPNQNATTVQVAIGVVAAVLYAIEHPNLGFCVPDDLHEEYILKIAEPFLGRFVSIASDYKPVPNTRWTFDEFFSNASQFQLH